MLIYDQTFKPKNPVKTKIAISRSRRGCEATRLAGSLRQHALLKQWNLYAWGKQTEIQNTHAAKR